MDVENRQIIEDLALTKSQERVLRRLVSPEPTGPLQSFLHRPRTGLKGALVALAFLAVLFALAFLIGQLFGRPFPTADIALPVWLIVLIYKLSERELIIAKLYRALVSGRAS